MTKENEKVLEVIRNTGKQVILFGAGQYGKEAASCIKEYFPEIHVVGFFDNNWILWGKRIIDDLYCMKPTDSWGNAVCLITISANYQRDVKRQVSNLGFEKIYEWESIEQPNRYQQKCVDLLNKRTPKKKIYYVIDIVEHCNLNCQMCDHFAPLSDRYFMTIESYCRDMERMAELFGEDIPFICLEGGEPLLHPEIAQFIREASKILPKTEIQIFTTGLNLPNMNQDFWSACRECRVILAITKYPISFEYEIIEKLAVENGVELRYFGGDITVKTSMHKPIDMEGKQNPYESFHSCYMANGECVDVKNGRLYPCTFAANLHIFNKRFGKNIEITSRDYIDLYTEVDADKIREFLCNPISACRYCKVAEWSYNHPWRISQKKIEEWT